MTVLKCFLAGTLPIAALTLGMLSAPGVASADQTTVCASENEWCSLPASTAYWQTSYGSADNKFVVTTQNVDQIPCSNTGLGDPAQGVVKRCAYEALSVTERPAGDFTPCAGEGGMCETKVTPGKYRLARYGKGNTWIYNNVSGRVSCELGKFYNWDPVPNVNKTCEVSTDEFPKGDLVLEWKDCGTEGGPCFPETGLSTYLIKYGVGDHETGTFVYRTIDGSSWMCNLETFRYDPAYGRRKSCFYLRSKAGKVTGQWERLIACDGCEPNKYKYTWGVEKGKTRERSSTFATELAMTAKVGIKVEGLEAGTEATTKMSTSNTNSLIESYTQTVGTEVEIPCAQGALWQFRTTVNEFCGPSNPSCSTTAKMQLFKCTTTTDQPKPAWIDAF